MQTKIGSGELGLTTSIKLEDLTDFNGILESLFKIMQGIGFRWSKIQSNRKVLMEGDALKFQGTNYFEISEDFVKRESQLFIWTLWCLWVMCTVPCLIYDSQILEH